MIDDEDLVRHDVFVASDNAWQRKARLLQARWREREALAVGLHRGRPLGSRLAMPFAKAGLASFMTATTREVVRAEVFDPRKSAGKVYEEPRLYDNLLTSQALCFNLFAELQRDLGLAARAVGRLLNRPKLVVTAIEFEHSPGRSDPRFTADRSAFDVFVAYDSGGDRGFVGIEVKYAESLNDKVARYRGRYDEVAQAMGCFVPDRLTRLRRQPLEQFWRNHLLAGSMLLDPMLGFRHGTFVVLYPLGNAIVSRAVEEYGACLAGSSTFASWSLESVLDVLQQEAGGFWVRAVRDRYVG